MKLPQIDVPQHWQVKQELLCYVLARGFALAPWKFHNLRTVGIWETDVQLKQPLDTDETGILAPPEEKRKDYHEAVVQLFDKQQLAKCSVIQCQPLNEPAASLDPSMRSSNSMVRSNKVQLAETLITQFEQLEAQPGDDELHDEHGDDELRSKARDAQMDWWNHRHGVGPRAKVRRKLLSRLDSPTWVLTIMVLVITDLAMNADGDKSQEENSPSPSTGFDLSSFAQIVFASDVILRMWAMGLDNYFRDWMCWVDLMLSLLDLVTVLSPNTDVGPKSAGRLLRLIRLVKIMRLGRVDMNQTWAGDEMLHRALLHDDAYDEIMSNSVPRVMVLIAGTAASAGVDILQAVRHNWEIIIFADTGGFANTVYQAWWSAQNQAAVAESGDLKSSQSKFDEFVDEIVTFGRLNFLRVGPDGDSVEDVKQLVTQRLVGMGGTAFTVSPCLLAAWKTYGELSEAAEREGAAYVVCLVSLLLVRFIISFLVILRAQLADGELFVDADMKMTTCTESPTRKFLSQLRQSLCSGMGNEDLLLLLVTVFPILASVLLVLRNKFYTRTKFETLRAAAEKTKRHIYEFRTRTGLYSNAKFSSTRLVECVRATRGTLEQTEAMKSKFMNADKRIVNWFKSRTARQQDLDITHPEDVPFNMLNTDLYCRVRLEDRKQEFSERAQQLSSRLFYLNMTIYIMGGAGTLLVVFEAYLWVGVTLAIINAAQTVISETQIEARIVRYNEGHANLNNLLDWWSSLTEGEQIKAMNNDKLVMQAEAIIEAVISSTSSSAESEEAAEEGIAQPSVDAKTTKAVEARLAKAIKNMEVVPTFSEEQQLYKWEASDTEKEELFVTESRQGTGDGTRLLMDTTGDGRVDTIAVADDKHGARQITKILVDTTGDGKVDTIHEDIMEGGKLFRRLHVNTAQHDGELTAMSAKMQAKAKLPTIDELTPALLTTKKTILQRLSSINSYAMAHAQKRGFVFQKRELKAMSSRAGFADGLGLGATIKSIVGDEFDVKALRLHVEIGGSRSKMKHMKKHMKKKMKSFKADILKGVSKSGGPDTAGGRNRIAEAAGATKSRKIIPEAPSAPAKQTTSYMRAGLGRFAGSLHAGHNKPAAQAGVQNKLAQQKIVKALAEEGACFAVAGKSCRVVHSRHGLIHYAHSEAFNRAHVGAQFTQEGRRTQFTNGYLRRLGEEEGFGFEWHVHSAADCSKNCDKRPGERMRVIRTGDVELVETHVPPDGMHLKFLDEKSMKLGEGIVLPQESCKNVKPSTLHDFILGEVCRVLNESDDNNLRTEESKQESQKAKPLSIVMVSDPQV
eukprot:g1810.t1